MDIPFPANLSRRFLPAKTLTRRSGVHWLPDGKNGRLQRRRGAAEGECRRFRNQPARNLDWGEPIKPREIMRNARAAFQKALQIDPNFKKATAGLDALK